METIYDVLKEEHEHMSDLLRQALQDGSRVSFFKVKLEADPHMMGEERILYPVLEEVEELRELMTQAHKEHDEAKTLIFEIEGMEERDEEWTPKLRELKQSVDHHIEEEESKVFEKARNILSQKEAEDMAQQYIEFKRSYMNRIETGGPIV